MTINQEVNAFVAAQNSSRGTDGVNLDSDALSGSVPSGYNAVTGLAGIPAAATPIALPTGTMDDPTYGVVLLDGSHSSTASAIGQPDSYSFSVDGTGLITVLDVNTGHIETITGASYLVFDGGATNTKGAYQAIYFIEGSANAQIAALYNAAFGRQPDLGGLEFYATQITNGALTLHQAATYILSSPEFGGDFPSAALPSDNGGPNDQAFITALYQNILHRTPSASEIAYYAADLQGSLPGVAQQDRAQLIINFAVSPENQSDISPWLINLSNGGYADSLVPLSAQTVATEGAEDGSVSAALLAPPTNSTYAEASNETGSTVIAGKGATIPGLALPIAANTITTTSSNMTITLSAAYNTGGLLGINDKIYGASGGGSTISLPSFAPLHSNGGGEAYLYGSGNTLQTSEGDIGVTTPTTIEGFMSGDFIQQGTGSTASYTGNTVLTGSASAPIKGSAISFVVNGSNPTNAVGVLAINVGNIANDSATTMAAAANAVYKVGDVAGEEVTFFGQDTSGNTVMFHWGLGDVNHDHLVDAGAFTGAEILVGVAAASITVSMFH